MTQVKQLHALTNWSVREASIPNDAQEIVDIVGVYDSEPIEVGEFVRLYREWDENDPRSRLVAFESDGIIGTAHVRRRAAMTQGLFFLNLYVRPENCRCGVGSGLLKLGEDFARGHSATHIVAFAHESCPHSRGFAESRGYVLERHIFESVLNISKVDMRVGSQLRTEAEHAGYKIQSLAEAGWNEDSKRRLYEIISECDLDEPATQSLGGTSYNDFLREVVNAAWFRPEGVFVAMRGKEWAAVHTIGPLDGSQTADATTDFTGVRRPHRGRNLGKTLKWAGIDYVRKLGRTKVMTHNDSTNRHMLAINDAMGFERRPGMFLMKKALIS